VACEAALGRAWEAPRPAWYRKGHPAGRAVRWMRPARGEPGRSRGRLGRRLRHVARAGAGPGHPDLFGQGRRQVPGQNPAVRSVPGLHNAAAGAPLAVVESGRPAALRTGFARAAVQGRCGSRPCDGEGRGGRRRHRSGAIHAELCEVLAAARAEWTSVRNAAVYNSIGLALQAPATGWLAYVLVRDGAPRIASIIARLSSP